MRVGAGGSSREARLARNAQAVLARRSPLWFALFARIFTRALRSDFHGVRIARDGPVPDPATPHLLIYSNHPSWWDAVIYVVLAHRLFPDRHAFAPIDAAMLGRYGFMGRIGAFGVAQQEAQGAATFLATAAAVLKEPENLLFVTAQGRFADPRERPIRLAPGLSHLLDRAPDATLVPLALDYPFWDERKPELLIRFGEPVAARTLLALPRPLRQKRLADGLETTLAALTRDAMARSPEAFMSLLDGRAGVGGVYDLWRRSKAAFRGERFTAAHGEHS